jgi:regulator of sirC expression with transglutaminase-like and TPR domain
MSPRSPKPKDVELLLSFLLDENPETVRLAREQVLELARSNPNFHKTVESARDARVRHEGRKILEDLRLDELSSEFTLLAAMGETLDLERAALALSRFGHPSTDEEAIRRQLDGFAAGLDEAIDAAEPDSIEAGELLMRYLFQELGFRGNSASYQDPDNSYFAKVLERRLGIPISLSCLALFVGWRLDIPVFGVGLPGHFILGHNAARGPKFFDPFNKGRALSQADCAALARKGGVEFSERLLEPTTRPQIFARMMVNLLNIYSERNDTLKITWLTRWLDLFIGRAG